jgi:hypothetical protein
MDATECSGLLAGGTASVSKRVDAPFLLSSQANLSATLHPSGTVSQSPVIWVEDNPRK